MRDLLLFSLPLLCLAPLLGVNPLLASAGAALLFVCSLTLALLVAAALDFIFASIMVLLEHSVYAMMKIRSAVSALLSGAVIPLALLPWGIGDVLGYLPFAALAEAPPCASTSAPAIPRSCSRWRRRGRPCCGRSCTSCGAATASGWSCTESERR